MSQSTPRAAAMDWPARHNLVPLLLAGLLLAACGEEPAAPEGGTPVITATVAMPVRGEVVQQVTAAGSVLAWQEVSVGAEIGGYRLAAIEADVGDRVRKGQLLARLDASVLAADLAEADAARAEARAALTEAEANAERARALKASGALSAREADQLITAQATAAARLQSAEARHAAAALRRSFAELRAPDDGVISARLASPGQVVAAGTELYRLIRRGRLEWRAEVQERDFARVRAGQPALVATLAGTVEGRVRTVSPAIDPGRRTGTVYVDLPADAPLKAGMFAEGAITVGSAPGLLVPLKALVQRDGFDYLFALRADGTVEQRRVTRGAAVGEQVEVVAGLAAADRVVVEGAGFLRDGDLVRVAPAAGAQP